MKLPGISLTPQAWTRGLLRCGVVAGPVFVTVFLAEGAVREGYRPLRVPRAENSLTSLPRACHSGPADETALVMDRSQAEKLADI
jgi:hypothetical protein